MPCLLSYLYSLIQLILLAELMGHITRQRPKPDAGQSGPVFFLRFQLRQAVIVNKAKVGSFYESHLFGLCLGLEELVLVFGLTDGFHERAADVLVKNLDGQV